MAETLKIVYDGEITAEDVEMADAGKITLATAAPGSQLIVTNALLSGELAKLKPSLSVNGSSFGNEIELHALKNMLVDQGETVELDFSSIDLGATSLCLSTYDSRTGYNGSHCILVPNSSEVASVLNEAIQFEFSSSQSINNFSRGFVYNNYAWYFYYDGNSSSGLYRSTSTVDMYQDGVINEWTSAHTGNYGNGGYDGNQYFYMTDASERWVRYDLQNLQVEYASGVHYAVSSYAQSSGDAGLHLVVPSSSYGSNVSVYNWDTQQIRNWSLPSSHSASSFDFTDTWVDAQNDWVYWVYIYYSTAYFYRIPYSTIMVSDGGEEFIGSVNLAGYITANQSRRVPTVKGGYLWFVGLGDNRVYRLPLSNINAEPELVFSTDSPYIQFVNISRVSEDTLSWSDFAGMKAKARLTAVELQ
jgi:hypothetical protein